MPARRPMPVSETSAPGVQTGAIRFCNPVHGHTRILLAINDFYQVIVAGHCLAFLPVIAG